MEYLKAGGAGLTNDVKEHINDIKSKEWGGEAER